jgi:hypothetical protein
MICYRTLFIITTNILITSLKWNKERMFSIDYILIVDAMCLLVDILLTKQIDSHKKNLFLF